jgi:hypothetical protein
MLKGEKIDANSLSLFLEADIVCSAMDINTSSL